MRILFIFVSLLLLSTASFAGSHSGHYTMSFDLSSHKTNRVAQLWIPYPVSDENQNISNLSWNGDYAEAAVYTDRDNGTPMLYVRWPNNAKQRTLTFTFDAERFEQRRMNLPTTEAAWNPADFKRYLAATSLGPTDGGVRELADRITTGQSTIPGKARAIYDWTVDNTFRDPETRGCGIGDVNKLLKRPGGKCADISSVFVAIARAAGVPSREVFGIRSGRDAEQDVTTWQHCWAEFFLPGTGWVPVDPADVRKAMLKQNLKPEDPEVAKLRKYFWGGIDPYRIRLAEGRDLVLNPVHHGPPLNYLMYPFSQLGEETLDWLDPETFSYRILWEPNRK